MFQLHLLLAAAAVVTINFGDATSTLCPGYPDSSLMNDEFRNFLLDTVNGYRSQLANGLLQSSNNNGTFPSGKNINKLFWDCQIEEAARELSETCQFEYNPDFSYSAYGAFYFRDETDPQRAMQYLIQDRFFTAARFEGDIKTENGVTALHHGSYYLSDKLEGFACWFGSENCNAEFNRPFAPPQFNISTVCGFSPIMPSTPRNPDGHSPDLTRIPITYVLGAPCLVDSDCTNPNGFTKCDATLGLCSTTSSPATTTTPSYNPCAAGWFYHSNSCYRYVNGSTGRSQAQAEQWCVNQGKKGHLVSIHNEAEDNFVKSLITSGGDNVLIGYNNEAWTDATSVDYRNFPAACGNNVCAAFSLPNYQWKSVDCNSTFKQFVCKRNL